MLACGHGMPRKWRKREKMGEREREREREMVLFVAKRRNTVFFVAKR